jgi:hypothetical protein
MSLQEEAGRGPRKRATHSNADASTSPSGGSMSIATFCERNEISRSFYYKMRRLGIGPAECQLGAAVRISYAAEAAWLRRAERAAKKTAAT